MTVNEALKGEINTLREKHIALVKVARSKSDPMYGMSTLHVYETLIDSYSRLSKALDSDS